MKITGSFFGFNNKRKSSLGGDFDGDGVKNRKDCQPLNWKKQDSKEYGDCQYHGKFELTEQDDWQCPKCEKELYDFGQFKRTGKISNDAKNLMQRAGIKF